MVRVDFYQNICCIGFKFFMSGFGPLHEFWVSCPCLWCVRMFSPGSTMVLVFLKSSHISSTCSFFTSNLSCLPPPWQHFEEIPDLSPFPSWYMGHTARLQHEDWVCFLCGLCLCHFPANSSLAFYWSTDALWTLTLSLSSRPAVECFFSGEKLLRHTEGWKGTGKVQLLAPWEGAGRWGVGRR